VSPPVADGSAIGGFFFDWCSYSDKRATADGTDSYTPLRLVRSGRIICRSDPRIVQRGGVGGGGFCAGWVGWVGAGFNFILKNFKPIMRGKGFKGGGGRFHMGGGAGVLLLSLPSPSAGRGVVMLFPLFRVEGGITAFVELCLPSSLPYSSHFGQHCHMHSRKWRGVGCWGGVSPFLPFPPLPTCLDSFYFFPAVCSFPHLDTRVDDCLNKAEP